MPSLRPACLLLLLAFSLPPVGCANIYDRPDVDGDPGNPLDPSDPGEPSSDDPGERTMCMGDSGSAKACEVTGDCSAPLVCVNSKCVGLQNPDVMCNAAEGGACKNAGEVCAGGVCMANPGACQTSDQCPLGYACSGGQCQSDRAAATCAEKGAGPDLAGTWKFDSKLHIRDAMPGVVAGVLDASGKVRDLLNGDIDLGLPGIVESIIGSVAGSIVRQYIPVWAQNLVYVLGDMGDVINDMRVESTVVFEKQACDGLYRGTERWNFITFTFRGSPMRVPPSNIPGVTEVKPDTFSARFSCGELFIDRHRIQGTLSQLIRWLLDTTTKAVTGYSTVEQAMSNMINCGQVGIAVDNYVYSACSFCPDVSSIVNVACLGFKNAAISKLTESINQSASELSQIKRKGIGKVDGATKLSGGKWYGSLVGGSFPGEFTATKN